MRTVAAGAGRLAGSAAFPVAALAIGLLYPLSAYAVSPLALPIAVALVGLAVVSYARPEIGVGVALVLTSLTEDVGGPRPWILGAVWTGALVAVSVLRLVQEGWPLRRLPPLSVAVLAVLAIDLVGLAVSGDPATATPFVRSTATGVALFLVIATQVRTPAQLRWVLGGAVGAAALVGFHAATQYLAGGEPEVGFFTASGELVGRVTGGFGHPNQLAAFLLVLVPLVLTTAILERRARVLTLVATALAVFGIYASFSRAALVALAAVPLVLLRGRRLLLLTPVLALALAFAMPDLLRERFATLTASGSEAATRIDFWQTSASIFGEHPVVGVGIGQFPRAYAEARVPGKQFLPTTMFEPPPHGHNLPLHLLAEQGLLGTVAFAVPVALAVRHALRLRRSPDAWTAWIGAAVLTSVAVFLVHNVFDVTLFEATAVHFWAVLGILSAAATMAEHSPDEITAVSAAVPAP